MVERFIYKKAYLIGFYLLVAISLPLFVIGFYQYFFIDDEFIFLFLFIGGGIATASGIYSVIEIKNFFVEITEQGIKTNKAECTWDMVQSVTLTEKGLILFYEDGDKKRGRIGFGSLIEGCDYAKSLVTGYTSQKEVENE